MALKYLYAPIGYEGGKAYGVLPNVADADLSFIRASGATKVIGSSNKTIDKGESLGSNIESTDFSSGWTGVGSGMTLSTGAAVYNNSSLDVSAYIQTNSDITLGKKYRIIIEVTSFTSATSGGLYYYSGNGVVKLSVDGVGTYEYTFTSLETRTFVLNSYTGTSLTVGSVSLKEITTTNLNTPRLDYTDYTFPTLLVEPERTNIHKYSEKISSWNFTPSNWGGTITENAEISPDGSQNADLISIITQSGVYMPTINVTQGTVYSTSVYAKHISGTSILKFALTARFHSGGGTSEKGIFVDLSDGSITSNTIGSAANVKVIDVGNGWYRLCIQNHVAGETGNVNVTFYGQNTTSMEYSLWGAQVEVGKYTSSYIPTYPPAISTRSADTGVISGDLSSYINSTEGVLEIRAKALFNGGFNNDVRIAVSDGTTDNRINLSWREVANRMSIFMKANGGDVLDGGTVGFKNFTHTQTEMTTFKIKWKSGDIQVKVNGSVILTQADTFTILGLNQVSLGKGYGGSGTSFEGNVEYIKVYDSVDDF